MALSFTGGKTWSNGDIANSTNMNAIVNSLSYSGQLEVAKGGTGATSAATAATALGLGTGDTPTFSAAILGSNTGQKLLTYKSTNTRYGMSVETSEHRIFQPSGADLSFGAMSTVDGTTYTEWGRWTNAGSFIVGTAAINTNATDGFLYIPTCAGTPSGTPTAKSGRSPVVYDSTNNLLYIYNGAWKSATFA